MDGLFLLVTVHLDRLGFHPWKEKEKEKQQDDSGESYLCKNVLHVPSVGLTSLEAVSMMGEALLI